MSQTTMPRWHNMLLDAWRDLSHKMFVNLNQLWFVTVDVQGEVGI